MRYTPFGINTGGAAGYNHPAVQPPPLTPPPTTVSIYRVSVESLVIESLEVHYFIAELISGQGDLDISPSGVPYGVPGGVNSITMDVNTHTYTGYKADDCMFVYTRPKDTSYAKQDYGLLTDVSGDLEYDSKSRVVATVSLKFVYDYFSVTDGYYAPASGTSNLLQSDLHARLVQRQNGDLVARLPSRGVFKLMANTSLYLYLLIQPDVVFAWSSTLRSLEGVIAIGIFGFTLIVVIGCIIAERYRRPPPLYESLNGNNGSWTNTDDITPRELYAFIYSPDFVLPDAVAFIAPDPGLAWYLTISDGELKTLLKAVLLHRYTKRQLARARHNHNHGRAIEVPIPDIEGNPVPEQLIVTSTNQQYVHSYVIADWPRLAINGNNGSATNTDDHRIPYHQLPGPSHVLIQELVNREAPILSGPVYLYNSRYALLEVYSYYRWCVKLYRGDLSWKDFLESFSCTAFFLTCALSCEDHALAMATLTFLSHPHPWWSKAIVLLDITFPLYSLFGLKISRSPTLLLATELCAPLITKQYNECRDSKYVKETWKVVTGAISSVSSTLAKQASRLIDFGALRKVSATLFSSVSHYVTTQITHYADVSGVSDYLTQVAKKVGPAFQKLAAAWLPTPPPDSMDCSLRHVLYAAAFTTSTVINTFCHMGARQARGQVVRDNQNRQPRRNNQGGPNQPRRRRGGRANGPPIAQVIPAQAFDDEDVEDPEDPPPPPPPPPGHRDNPIFDRVDDVYIYFNDRRGLVTDWNPANLFRIFCVGSTLPVKKLVSRRFILCCGLIGAAFGAIRPPRRLRIPLGFALGASLVTTVYTTYEVLSQAKYYRRVRIPRTYAQNLILLCSRLSTPEAAYKAALGYIATTVQQPNPIFLHYGAWYAIPAGFSAQELAHYVKEEVTRLNHWHGTSYMSQD